MEPSPEQAILGSPSAADATYADSHYHYGYNVDYSHGSHENATLGDASGTDLIGTIIIHCLIAGDKVTFAGAAVDETDGFLGLSSQQVDCPQSLTVDVRQDYPTADGIDGHAGDTDDLTGTITEINPLGLTIATFTRSQTLTIQ